MIISAVAIAKALREEFLFFPSFWISFCTLTVTSFCVVSSTIVLQYSHFFNTKPSLYIYTFFNGLLAKQLGHLFNKIHLSISSSNYYFRKISMNCIVVN